MINEMCLPSGLSIVWYLVCITICYRSHYLFETSSFYLMCSLFVCFTAALSWSHCTFVCSSLSIKYIFSFFSINEALPFNNFSLTSDVNVADSFICQRIAAVVSQLVLSGYLCQTLQGLFFNDLKLSNYL